MDNKPTFSGWATKYNIHCKDGRTIMPGAFSDCHQKTVPMVYMHSHDDIGNVLGKAVLSHKDDGVWADCFVNDTEGGQTAKKLVEHGDITSFSIFADELVETASGVVSHGDIKELSLVLAGANSGASIENVITHGLNGEIYTDDTAAIFKMENGEICMQHADEPPKPDPKPKDDDTKKDPEGDDGETVAEVLESFTDDEKDVLYFMVGAAIESVKGGEVKHDNIEGGNNMSYNCFEGNGTPENNTLSHSAMAAIFADAPQYGSLKKSCEAHQITNVKYLQHGITDVETLFPDATLINNPPAWIKRPDGWVSKVMNGVKHRPFANIKSMFADITEDDARAKGYIKGKMKKEEFFSLIKRTTMPTTIYKKQAMDRDDIIDITNFDVVAWLKGEMRMMLDEELARAFLIGDGRSAASDDKINELNIRPIVSDDDLFTIKKAIQISASATASDRASIFIDEVIRSRKEYRGSGNPTMFTTDDVLADLLLFKDANGRYIYESVDKLKGTLRVSDIVTVPVMEGAKDKDGNAIAAIIVNLDDYSVGADKGGAVSMFEDFDIDFNKEKYLIETRCSGALTVPASAIAYSFKTVTSGGAAA